MHLTQTRKEVRVKTTVGTFYGMTILHVGEGRFKVYGNAEKTRYCIARALHAPGTHRNLPLLSIQRTPNITLFIRHRACALTWVTPRILRFPLFFSFPFFLVIFFFFGPSPFPFFSVLPFSVRFPFRTLRRKREHTPCTTYVCPPRARVYIRDKWLGRRPRQSRRGYFFYTSTANTT